MRPPGALQVSEASRPDVHNTAFGSAAFDLVRPRIPLADHAVGPGPAEEDD